MTENKPQKGPGGRPKIELDKEQFEGLCRLQCTREEMLGWFGITDKTLTRWIKDTYGRKYSFSAIFDEKRAGGKISLRRSQFRLAETNAALAIWLGKQYLGQTDKLEHEDVGDNSVLKEIAKRLPK